MDEAQRTFFFHFDWCIFDPSSTPLPPRPTPMPNNPICSTAPSFFLLLFSTLPIRPLQCARSLYMIINKLSLKVADQMANRVDLDQAAPAGAV